jgi:hypothetical protein
MRRKILATWSFPLRASAAARSCRKLDRCSVASLRMVRIERNKTNHKLTAVEQPTSTTTSARPIVVENDSRRMNHQHLNLERRLYQSQLVVE